jgi:Virulence factor membrane-bound polymerase, C-terminal/O-Antigen ligase/Protein glycosylation ligase
VATVSLLFAALFGVASWLTPNHSAPWSSFHAEFVMALAFAVAMLGEVTQRPKRADVLAPLMVATLVVALVPLVQVATGLVRFAGDGWMVFAYLLGLALAQWLGQRLAWRWGLAPTAEVLAGLFLAGSVASVGLQIYQWLQLLNIGLFAVQMAPFGTPFANFAQPNHLATALFLGLAGLLYLFERRHLGGAVAAAATLFLLFGMVMTGSRTAWVAIALLVPALVLARRRLALRLPVAAVLGLGLAFVALVMAWPVLNELLLLAPGRTLSNQAQAGPRPLFYATMLDAVSRHPWVGYGWNQGLVAQSAVLDAHPAGGRLMGNSHNTVLDLMVWNGMPLALGITGLLAWWAWRQVRACRDVTALFLLTALGGVAVHAMLEYPLSYAYFLLPVGLMMGLLEAAAPSRWQLPLPRGVGMVAAGSAAALLAVITVDYLEVEANTQVLAWEVARIGTSRITSHAPDVMLLTQWREYLAYARIEPGVDMADTELARMAAVVARFPYSSALRQYAVANALNGRPEVARDTLARLCKLHSVTRCRNELLRWNEQLRAGASVLAAVPLPPMPEAVPERVAAPMPALAPAGAAASARMP